VSSFSSYAQPGELPDNGLDDDHNGWVDDVVDVVAPGEGIWSSWVLAAYDSLVYEALLGLEGWPPGADTYSAADGTSFSTPLAAGYLGLLLARHPGATAAQLRNILRSSALDLAPSGYDARSGFGRLRMLVPATLPGSSNLVPVADIAGDQLGRITVADTGKSGQESVTLDGSTSVDPDGSIVAYRWTWVDAQGVTRTGSGVRLSVQLVTNVQYPFTLTVEDDDGALSAPDNVLVTVTPKTGGKGKPPR
jgi:subtilisin family serine protease